MQIHIFITTETAAIGCHSIFGKEMFSDEDFPIWRNCYLNLLCVNGQFEEHHIHIRNFTLISLCQVIGNQQREKRVAYFHTANFRVAALLSSDDSFGNVKDEIGSVNSMRVTHLRCVANKQLYECAA